MHLLNTDSASQFPRLKPWAPFYPSANDNAETHFIVWLNVTSDKKKKKKSRRFSAVTGSCF